MGKKFCDNNSLAYEKAGSKDKLDTAQVFVRAAVFWVNFHQYADDVGGLYKNEIHKCRPVVLMDPNPIIEMLESGKINVIPLSKKFCQTPDNVRLKEADYRRTALTAFPITIDANHLFRNNYQGELSSENMRIIEQSLFDKFTRVNHHQFFSEIGAGKIFNVPWENIGTRRFVILGSSHLSDYPSDTVIAAPVDTIQQLQEENLKFDLFPLSIFRLMKAKPCGVLENNDLVKMIKAAKKNFGLIEEKQKSIPQSRPVAHQGHLTQLVPSPNCGQKQSLSL